MTGGGSRARYVARINRVIDHVEAHLAEPLPLEELARIAAFSPYHFHRVFKSMTGEALGRFVQRLRLERAASWLTALPDRPVTDIALDAGFSGSDTFARAFRGHFGVTPTAWRADGCQLKRGESKIGMANRNPGQAWRCERSYHPRSDSPMQWRLTMSAEQMEAQVVVEEQPERTLAYVRHIGPYQGDSGLFERLFGQLFGWAGPRGLVGPGVEMMSVYHDDPEVTPADKLRISVGLTVPADTPVDGPVGKLTLPAGQWARARFSLRPDQYGDAWAAVMGGWLPDSGYEPADGPCLESYVGEPGSGPDCEHVVDICVPVRPAT